MLPFLGFATQDWYRLAQETDRHFCLSVAFLGTTITIVLLWAASRFKVCVCVSVCECVYVCVSVCE